MKGLEVRGVNPARVLANIIFIFENTFMITSLVERVFFVVIVVVVFVWLMRSFLA